MTTERTSYLTADEVRAAHTLHRRAPYAVCHVSNGFFSIARHYGGMTFQGCHYTYMPGHDECVRDDVLLLVTEMRKKPGEKEAQPSQSMLDLVVCSQRPECAGLHERICRCHTTTPT